MRLEAHVRIRLPVDAEILQDELRRADSRTGYGDARASVGLRLGEMHDDARRSTSLRAHRRYDVQDAHKQLMHGGRRQSIFEREVGALGASQPIPRIPQAL